MVEAEGLDDVLVLPAFLRFKFCRASFFVFCFLLSFALDFLLAFEFWNKAEKKDWLESFVWPKAALMPDMANRTARQLIAEKLNTNLLPNGE